MPVEGSGRGSSGSALVNKNWTLTMIRNRSSRTAEAYIANIASFMKWTGNKPMEELCLQDAREFILFKRKSAVSVSTCNFYNSSIAFLYKHVLHIPWDQDVVPRMRMDARLPKVLSLSEVETLIAAASHIRNKAIIALLYSSGLKGVLEELPC